MNQDKLKQMYANGGLLKALLKDPAQRKMAAQMLGGKEYGQGGMMKYANGGPVGPGGPTGKPMGTKQWLESNMPYYEYDRAFTPEFSGPDMSQKIREYTMSEALPAVIREQRGSQAGSGYDQLYEALSSYEPAEGQNWLFEDARAYALETLGPEHQMFRRSDLDNQNPMQRIAYGLSSYLNKSPMYEQALYQVDPASGQRTRVTQEMYEQAGSPSEFAKVQGANNNYRYYAPSTMQDERFQQPFQHSYRYPEMRPLSSSAVFR